MSKTRKWLSIGLGQYADAFEANGDFAGRRYRYHGANDSAFSSHGTSPNPSKGHLPRLLSVHSRSEPIYYCATGHRDAGLCALQGKEGSEDI